MEFPDDDGLEKVLGHLGTEAGALLGHGGEAWVYALDEWYEPARRRLAAFWARATDDPPLHSWCRHVLLD